MTTASKEKLFKSIARQIRDMVDGHGDIKYVIDKESGTIRPVHCSDIAVLARSNNDVDKITKALNDKDIPVVCEKLIKCDCKELRLVYLLLNYMIDESPLLKAEIAHLLFGVKTSSVLEDKESVLKTEGFDKLNDLKDRLKTLPVADIVKALVIELDLINRCKKWGMAAQRERTLQALIEDAKAFDDNAITMGEASSIEHYLIHLDEEGVTVKKGFFQEGVHVLTYHKSKGLQWNIVILCSLDDNSLNENTLKKRFAIGVNYIRKSDPSANQLYSDYYLTCLPAFLSSRNSNLNEDMMAEIASLGTYHQYVDRLYYESQRLLYVSVTRARDYLITTSLDKKNPMPWLTYSGIAPLIDGKCDYQAIWGEGDGITKSRFVKVDDDGSYQPQPEPGTYFCRKEQPTTKELGEKYLSPSKMKDPALTEKVQPRVLYPVKDEIPHPIQVSHGAEDEYDIMGTCVHNIFAIYDPQADAAEIRNKAQKIVTAYGMNKMLPDIEGIFLSISSLYQFLEKRYGKPAKVEHEVPFRRETNGQVVSGEMDLLWYTSPTECVLIDFKNYPGIMAHALSKTHEEYVGQYAGQLKAYEEALVAAGKTVKAKLIYYSVLGYLVELEG